MKYTQFLNINVQNINKKQLLQQLNKGVLITPNVDHLVKLQKDREFYETYQKAEWVVCDSKILYILSKLLKNPLPEAIPGSSFLRHFMNIIKMIQIVRYFCLEQQKVLQLKPWKGLIRR